MSILQLRIKTCIQTLLDLQPVLHHVYQRNMAEDFTQLQIWLEKVEKMPLAEEDVARIESITSELLKEIGITSCPPAVRAIQ